MAQIDLEKNSLLLVLFVIICIVGIAYAGANYITNCKETITDMKNITENVTEQVQENNTLEEVVIELLTPEDLMNVSNLMNVSINVTR